MRKGEVAEVDILGLAYGGDGVARLEEGLVVFVPGGLPGERARVTLTEVKKSHARGELVELLSESEQRVEPGCAHFDRCGGCDLWHVEPAAQLALKAGAAAQTIARVSKFEGLPEPELFPAPSHTRWRTRATYHVRRVQERLLVGFYQRKSHRIVELDSCAVLSGPLDSFRELFIELFAPALWRAQLFAEMANEHEVVLTLSSIELPRSVAPRALARAAQRLVDESDEVKGVTLKWGGRSETFGRVKNDASYALARLPEALENEKLPAGMFRQANRELNNALVDYVCEKVGETTHDILELFAGCGNLSFGLAELTSGRVLAIEGASRPVKIGKRLAREAGLSDRLSFVCADLDDKAWATSPRVEGRTWPIVVLDPPRSGAARVCKELAKWDALERIVYVACDSACMARDLKALGRDTWEVEELAFFDMFPHTAHVEAVAVLKRR